MNLSSSTKMCILKTKLESILLTIFMLNCYHYFDSYLHSVLCVIFIFTLLSLFLLYFEDLFMGGKKNTFDYFFLFSKFSFSSFYFNLLYFI